ncbi:DUF6232 family protein [Paraburkholderia bonniea]|uniref:DUF6232 family protein n=1 Tax=Paraburkholderia bonniea TaxID=2152891 RepID=UPI0012924BBF|nr:DUF6232 family protein [Paraburkholderia bonniea]WJF92091.1 DUF6232 family protein [Paraburkholderia bonniea]WJF95411.1 DUF6232 family protein [Paraburkholderia bonniea]
MDIPFNERGVSITRNALSAAGQVFPLRDIQQVRVVTVPRQKFLPLLLTLVGIASALAGAFWSSPAGLVCGVMLAVVGWLAWRTQDVMHCLRIKTQGAEREALASVDLDFVERVAHTVRHALSTPSNTPPGT